MPNQYLEYTPCKSQKLEGKKLIQKMLNIKFAWTSDLAAISIFFITVNKRLKALQFIYIYGLHRPGGTLSDKVVLFLKANCGQVFK